MTRVTRLLLLVVALLAGAALGACDDGEVVAPGEVTREDVADADEDDQALVDESTVFAEGEKFEGNQYLGERVTVTGEVTEIVTETVIVIGGDGFEQDGVLVSRVLDTVVEVGDRVRVTGMVLEFEPTELEDNGFNPQTERGGSDVSPGDKFEPILERFSGEPIITADRVEILAP